MTEGPTRRERLELNRDRLAQALDADDTDARSLASIAKELRATVAELDSLDDGQEVDSVDELAARRSGTAQAKVPARTGGKRQRRAASD